MLTFLLLAVTSWVPGARECTEPAFLNARRLFVEEVRARKPDSPAYIPIPFPQRDKDVVKDFKASILRGNRYDNRQIVDGVRSNAYRYEILRVTGWVTEYCIPFGRSPVILLRLFDRASGQEITRVPMGETGFVNCCIPSPSAMRRIPTMAEADRVLERANIRAHDAEYMFIRQLGESPDTPMHPCVGYRNDDGSYFVADDGLWFISKDARHISWRTAIDPEKLQKELESMPPGAKPYWIGGDDVVIAVPVATP